MITQKHKLNTYIRRHLKFEKSNGEDFVVWETSWMVLWKLENHKSHYVGILSMYFGPNINICCMISDSAWKCKAYFEVVLKAKISVFSRCNYFDFKKKNCSTCNRRNSVVGLILAARNCYIPFFFPPWFKFIHLFFKD